MDDRQRNVAKKVASLPTVTLSAFKMDRTSTKDDVKHRHRKPSSNDVPREALETKKRKRVPSEMVTPMPKFKRQRTLSSPTTKLEEKRAPNRTSEATTAEKDAKTFAAIETVLTTYSKSKSNVLTRDSAQSRDKVAPPDVQSVKTVKTTPSSRLTLLNFKKSKRTSLSNSNEDEEKDERDDESTKDGSNEEKDVMEEVVDVSDDDTIRKNTEKWFKRTKQLPDRLGTSTFGMDKNDENDSDDAQSAYALRASPRLGSTAFDKNDDSNKRTETLIIEDDSSLKYVNKRNRKKRKTSKRRPSRSSSSSSVYEDNDDDANEGAEGSYVRLTPTGMESQLVRIAKDGHSQALQTAAVHTLMRIKKSIFCDDITQDPLENVNYVDPNKTNVDYYPTNRRENYVKHVVSTWMEEDFIKAYQNTETMTLLEQYEAVEKTLEEDNDRKKNVLKTGLKDLPKIDASYVASFLREPILDLGERRCIAGDCCLSYYLFNFVKNNTPLVSTQTDPTSHVTVDPEKGVWKSEDARSTSQQQQKGFILREFLLPAQKMQLETDINMGIPIKEALERIERRHCILCNRYLTTIRAARISAGIRDLPTNTIQDHRNYFDCVGEYPTDSMLYFSGDYCGIIGEMVAFKTSDYVLACIDQYKYNVTSQEERESGKIRPDTVVRLRSWVEKNLITGMKKHEEGIATVNNNRRSTIATSF